MRIHEETTEASQEIFKPGFIALDIVFEDEMKPVECLIDNQVLE